MLVVVEACTGLSKNNLNEFGIYPNPVTDQLYVRTNGESVKITVTDLSGRVLSSQLSTTELNSVDVTRLNAGVYFIEVSSNSNVRIEKFIKH